MRNWLVLISGRPDDIAIIDEAYVYFSAEYEKARFELRPENLEGRRIREVAAKIPGMAEDVYAHWAELKAIVHFLENRVQAATQKSRKFYLEGYNKTLGANQVENFAKADPEVIKLLDIQIKIELILNKWEGVTKGLASLSYQIKNLTELRVAGFEEATI